MAGMTQAVRTAAQAAKDAVVFKALANAVRLQIVSFVAASAEGQVSAGEIVDRFDLSQPTISHHLRVLREAGVLTTVKSSTFVYYRFAPSLQESVAAVLPSSAAAAPPGDFVPAKRAVPAGTAGGAALTAGDKPLAEHDAVAPATAVFAHAGPSRDADDPPRGKLEERTAKDRGAKSKDKKSKKDKRSKKDKKK